MSLEAKLEAKSKEFQKLQRDYSISIKNLEKLQSQLQENEIVQKEFKILNGDANIYKLIGPVLVKQERAEAVSNVDKRIDYIRSEIKRVEGLIKDLGQQQDAKRQELMELQSSLQSARAGSS
ncbi:Prefoldin subunit 6 [Dimargaris xerosporica]|nr:Prefoldin subunit 6 [Dimargaris xerosporica]